MDLRLKYIYINICHIITIIVDLDQEEVCGYLIHDWYDLEALFFCDVEYGQ